MPSSYRVYRNNPGYIRKADGVTYRYNNYGFRNEDDVVDKQPDEFRVFILGGSAAYGERGQEVGQYQLISKQTTYPSSETIAAYLETELGKRMPGKHVKVFNAAVVAYRIHQNYMQYLEVIRTLSPDLLIALDGQNEDYRLENPYSYNVGWMDRMGGGPYIRFLRQHSYTMFYFGEYFHRSEALMPLRGRRIVDLSEAEMAKMDVAEIRRAIQQRMDDYEVNEAAMKSLLDVYECFNHATRLDSVPILFCTQSILAMDTTHKMTETEIELLKYWNFKELETSPAYAIRHLAERLQAKSDSDPTFHYLSLLEVFHDFSGDAYTDYCHTTPAANAHIARRLPDYVMSNPDLRVGLSDSTHVTAGTESKE